MENIQKEIEKLKKDREESNVSLRLNIDSFAQEMKDYLGEEIKKELKNPSNMVKKQKKSKWQNLKEKLNRYFFSDNENYNTF